MMLLKASLLLPLCAAAAIETYDYIVVGSGPGGGPLAANLARAGHSTLLLEAGSDQGSNPNITQLSNLLYVRNDPKIAWDFFVRHSNDPKRQANYNELVWLQTDGQYYTGLNPPAGAKQLGIWYPRAGTLGGCATHNAAAALLPANSDWNYISSITGDKSWQAANMRTYFEKLEKNLYLPKGTPGHGFNGYLNVSQDNSTWATVNSDAREIGLLAAQAIDPKITAGQLQSALQKDINALDPNRDTKESIYGFAVHASKGVRATPIDYIRATLADAARFPLTVKTNSLVTKVLFDVSANHGPKGPRATGVEVLQGESLYAADRRSN
ncbi:Cellobiose dehydrogenase [Elsinoe australis]|uniref:Cellobiose dehydrogenase n=1 Tax=Elsinoe australis TaxID=40998 RepID=A0A2P7YBT7_9PEZI|nr:Cellobiose dehydrogenase [Elsinoe australis]